MKIQSITYRRALEDPAYKVHGLQVVALTTVETRGETYRNTRTRIFATLTKNNKEYVVEEISKNFESLRVQPRTLYDAEFNFPRDARAAIFKYLDEKYVL